MKKNFKVISCLLIVFVIPVVDSCQQKETNDDWQEIESVFEKIENLSSKKRKCSFEYKEGMEPDVDVFDPEFKMILSELSKKQVVKLIDYYCVSCMDSLIGDDGTDFKSRVNFFLDESSYSIQLDYKQMNGVTSDVICLIYNSKRYLFFSIY